MTTKKRKYPFGWPFLPTEKGFPAASQPACELETQQ